MLTQYFIKYRQQTVADLLYELLAFTLANYASMNSPSGTLHVPVRRRAPLAPA